MALHDPLEVEHSALALFLRHKKKYSHRKIGCKTKIPELSVRTTKYHKN